MLDVNAETGWLDFKVMNSIEAQQQSKDKTSGIGLANVRRRLELLYKDRYRLDIKKERNIYHVHLTLTL